MTPHFWEDEGEDLQTSATYAEIEKPAHRPRIELNAVEIRRLAALPLTKEHIAEGLCISSDTLARRLASDQEIAEAFAAGRHELREMVSANIMEQAKKNPIAALALANQAHILDFKTPSQRVEGRVDHVLNLSPAQLTYLEKREKRGLLPLPAGAEEIELERSTPAGATFSKRVEN